MLSDWVLSVRLREQLPLKQGLRLGHKIIFHIKCYKTQRTTSTKTRIKTVGNLFQPLGRTSTQRTTSTKTRIKTCKTVISVLCSTLSENNFH